MEQVPPIPPVVLNTSDILLLNTRNLAAGRLGYAVNLILRENPVYFRSHCWASTNVRDDPP